MHETCTAKQWKLFKVCNSFAIPVLPRVEFNVKET